MAWTDREKTLLRLARQALNERRGSLARDMALCDEAEKLLNKIEDEKSKET